MMNEVDLNACFNDLEKASMEILTSNNVYSIQNVLAVNNVLLLKRPNLLSASLKKVFPSAVITALYKQQQEPYKSIDVAFPVDKRQQIEEILEEFVEENDLMQTRKRLNLLNNDVEDDDVFRIINLVSSLIYEVTPNDCAASENRLTASFVHSIMMSIFKTSVDYVPHMSNHTNKQDEGSLWRPDYKVSIQQGTSRVVHVCFGEVKPASCTSQASLDKDLTKVAVYSKKTLEGKKFNFLLSFVVKNNIITVYMMQNFAEGFNTLVEIENLPIPTTIVILPSISVILTNT
ncbi:hypothetical protein BD560DRAFT_195887 [Blakeslea trispora]|nr:hypothetical protein BD560DRAFT_195887 [Blakeslea trispora]